MRTPSCKPSNSCRKVVPVRGNPITKYRTLQLDVQDLRMLLQIIRELKSCCHLAGEALQHVVMTDWAEFCCRIFQPDCARGQCCSARKSKVVLSAPVRQTCLFHSNLHGHMDIWGGGPGANVDEHQRFTQRVHEASEHRPVGEVLMRLIKLSRIEPTIPAATARVADTNVIGIVTFASEPAE
jgi:hypothetical protein